MTTTIYVLIDPVTSEAKYVGKTIASLKTRLDGHMFHRDTRKGKSLRSKWVNKLIAQGLKPEILPLETVSNSEWKDAECFWIECLRFVGFDLLNMQKGGSSPPSAPLSQKHKDKIRASNIANGKKSAQTCKRMSDAKKNMPAEARLMYQTMAKALPRTPEGRKKAGDKLRGKPMGIINKRIKSSQYKGVSLKKDTGAWCVGITFFNKSIYVGSFKNEIDAAIAYDTKAKELYGDAAILNFL